MKIAFETLGCKLNQAETEAAVRRFLQAGHQLVTRVEDADVYILNTCTVTSTADARSRQLLRRARRKNPNIVVAVTGCYADRAPLDLARLDEVNIVTGNQGKAALLERLEDANLLHPVPVPAIARHRQAGMPGATQQVDAGRASLPAQSILRTRTFVKIQDGCRRFCAYCIVPYVRREEVSVPPRDVLEQIKQRVAEGYQEVVLTGTRIGAYSGHGLTLTDLTRRILDETQVARLRLSSLQPQEISPGLLDLWKDPRLCPHFHLSLQSGSETVLKRMRRRYTPSEYTNAVAWIRSRVQDVAVTTDVIVGFPGETDAEFRDSLAFCRRMEFARIHVFPFSPRQGTEAAAMPLQVPDTIKKERTRQMLAVAAESIDRFRQRFAGATLDVLWEKQTGQGVWSGVTGNYLRVYRRDGANLANKVSSARVCD
jgi:threonylcarbamoyladenosine tRNA methylthiotransferase MtaB